MLSRIQNIRKHLAVIAARFGAFRLALALRGLAPIAGGDETPEEKAAREKKEADEAEAKKKRDGEWTPPSKAEWDNLQRQQRETAESLKKVTDAEAERQKKADEEAGNHKAIAERAEARAKAAEEESARLKSEGEASDRQRRAERVASRLKFRDPGDVTHRLSDEALTDDSKTEAALKALATEKPYLVTDGEVPRQRDVTGDPPATKDAPEPTGVDRMARAYAASAPKT